MYIGALNELKNKNELEWFKTTPFDLRMAQSTKGPYVAFLGTSPLGEYKWWPFLALRLILSYLSQHTTGSTVKYTSCQPLCY